MAVTYRIEFEDSKSHTMRQRRTLQLYLASPLRCALKPSVRNTTQRRYASGEMPKLTGAADNAFNRERMAVKQHAAASSGTLIHLMYLPDPPTDAILDLWRKLSL